MVTSFSTTSFSTTAPAPLAATRPEALPRPVAIPAADGTAPDRATHALAVAGIAGPAAAAHAAPGELVSGPAATAGRHSLGLLGTTLALAGGTLVLGLGAELLRSVPQGTFPHRALGRVLQRSAMGAGSVTAAARAQAPSHQATFDATDKALLSMKMLGVRMQSGSGDRVGYDKVAARLDGYRDAWGAAASTLRDVLVGRSPALATA